MNLLLRSLMSLLDRGREKTRKVCAYPDCPSQSLMRCIPQTRAGIRVGAQWYCGADCFAAAACTTLAVLAIRGVAEMPKSPRLSLGLVLLSKGFLSDEQLRAVSEHCRWSGEQLDAALLRRGLVTEKQLAVAHAAQWGCPVFALERTGRMVEVDLPRSILESCEAVPLHYSAAAGRVLLGFVRRLDHRLLDAIERMTGCRAEPCFISSAEFAEQMNSVTFVPDYEETVIEGMDTPERMARTIARHAVQVAATTAELSRFRDFIWARVSGKRGTADVIFRTRQDMRVQAEIFPAVETMAEAVAG